ncbi:30S ribosomal protein S1 [Desulfosarcina sp. OttesenSCG-928-G17]|nr:30S ribosomal protein S1 [Desulfosarcina sp. OttesenSCG-928-G17]
MNDDFENASPEPEENFAELLEAYSAGMNDAIQVGDQIRGRIIAISDQSVFVDTGTKVDGVVEKNELLDEEGNLPFSEGDELDLYVVAHNESEIRLSKAISGAAGAQILQDAWSQKIPVEGKVVAAIKGGFQVEIAKRRAFCPISQMDVVHVDDPAPYVDQTFSFLIKRFEESGRNIVVSRRELLQKEIDASRKAFMDALEPDAVLEGTVTRMMPFGVFVRLAPGVEGLVHISELSWSRLDTPDQAVAVGDTLQVRVLDIKPGQKSDTPKISLSAKQVMGDPWADAFQKVQVGATLPGKITRCAPFGAFVELFPGIEGLVHISEMSYTRRVMRAEEVVSPGDAVMVVVKSIEPDRKRISLSLKAAKGDPWDTVMDTFKPGETVPGWIEKKETFGFFINLSPGITGLLPKSKIAASKNATALESARPGAEISVTIDNINVAERKIALSVGGDEDGGESENRNWKDYVPSRSASHLGSLGDQLQEALSRKKGGG